MGEEVIQSFNSAGLEQGCICSLEDSISLGLWLDTPGSQNCKHSAKILVDLHLFKINYYHHGKHEKKKDILEGILR